MSEMNESKRKKYTAPALEKGLDIIEFLAPKVSEVTLSEIALGLRRSVGEIFRMTVVLQQRGYLAYNPASESYQLTLKLFELSHHNAPIQRLTSAANPVMKTLARDLEQSCHLTVYYSGKCLVVAQRESPGPSGFNVRLGSQVKVVQSCSGRVILAFSDPEARKVMLSECPRSEVKKIQKKELNEVLTRIKENGYESMDSLVTHGVKDIGFPVFNHIGEVVAALTVPFLERIDGSQKVSLKSTVKRLSEAAQEISTSLGFCSGG